MKRIVVITGMHRSGTSLLGSILQSLGVDLGSSLITADTNNQAGYFENRDIVRVHAELLDLLDRRWVGLKGTLDYPLHWWTRPDVREIQERLAQIVRDETMASTGIWGFKDPRVCRLVPLWKEIFKQLDLLPIYYLSVRDPSAVTGSIAIRDELSSSKAQLLWLRHNLEAIRECRGQALMIMEYERWFSEPEIQVRQMIHSLEAHGIHVSQEQATHALDQINTSLRHHQQHSEARLPFVDELHACLHQASVTGEIPERIYEIDKEFVTAASIFQPWAEVIDRLPQKAKPSAQDCVEPNKLLSRLKKRVQPR